MKNKDYFFLVTATPLLDSKNKTVGVIETFQDITKQKKLEIQNEKLIAKLKESLNKVKILSGFIPICSSCKKIRDDKGFWNQIECYLKDHSDAKFSHGICPDCAKKLYPDLIK